MKIRIIKDVFVLGTAALYGICAVKYVIDKVKEDKCPEYVVEDIPEEEIKPDDEFQA